MLMPAGDGKVVEIVLMDAAWIAINQRELFLGVSTRVRVG